MALNVIYADGKTGEIENEGDQLEVVRHSTSHLMAAAVHELFPDTHLGIGPAISDGFYYDFERSERFTEADLPKIEEKMRELAGRKLKFEPSIISQQEAIDFFSARGEHLKVELIREKAGETLSCYRLGDLVDFCTGPHVLSTEAIQPRNFRLLSVAGSYWKGTSIGSSSSAFMGPVSFPRPIWTPILHRSKKPSGATTANWGASWISTASRKKPGRA